MLHRLGIWILRKLIPIFIDRGKMPYGICDIIIYPRSAIADISNGKLYIEMLTTIIQAKDAGTPKEKMIELYMNAKSNRTELEKLTEFILDVINEIYDNKENYYMCQIELYK